MYLVDVDVVWVVFYVGDFVDWVGYGGDLFVVFGYGG